MRLKLIAAAVGALAPVMAMLAYNEYAMRSQRRARPRPRSSGSSRDAIAIDPRQLVPVVR